MNIRPTRTFIRCLCVLGTSVLILISCSKDNDIFLDAVLTKEENQPAEEDTSTVDENEDQVEGDTDTTEGEMEDLESRITVFPAINDAYVQNGQGFDDSLIRLQENFRRSYLMFDLTPIGSINGKITAASLRFVINSDDGNGTVKAFITTSNDWSENSISEATAPESDNQIGEIEQTYKIGDEVEIVLNISEITLGVSTLILEHENGNDLAFASKESTTKPGPKLEVTYEAPVSSEAIVIDDNQVMEGSEEEDSEEENTDDETSEEDTTEEDNTGEDTTEGDNTGEDTTEEDNTGEDTTEGDNTEEDTTEGDNTEEDTTEEDNTGEDTTEEDTTGDDTTEDDTTEDEGSNTAPVAKAEASPLNGTVPLEVNFNASNSSDDKTITSFEWDFKDGSTSTASNSTHTFSQPGNYNVTLKVTDAEGLNATDTITITVTEKENEAPVAEASANILSGEAPLAVNFSGSSSTDDNSITGYQWDFKDGASSNTANPSHTFDTPGTYAVSLTVGDDEGLTNTSIVTITVVAPPVTNEAPIAIANANRLTGEAPLVIDFTGSNSTDDVGIVDYLWDFQSSTSSDVNPSYTFMNAGNYTVTLTVTDAEGLQSTSSLSITVNPEPPSNTGPIPCSVGGSLANVPGEKVWCWNGLASEINAAGPLAAFSSGQLAKSVHYDGQGVRVSGNRLRFKLNPNSPNSGNGNNYRSEIRENPSNVDHALGTEQWYGWDYKFENDYKADASFEWIMWQVHGSFSSPAAPLISLWVAKQNMAKQTNAAGEIFVTNAAYNTNSAKHVRTGIVPQAGQTLKIVIHVIWGDANTGLYEVWINGNKIYSEHERTVYREQPEGGYAKWGIYKWKWQSNSNVSSSASQGITELNTSMGTLRSVMRRPNDIDYGKDAYSLVAPD